MLTSEIAGDEIVDADYFKSIAAPQTH